MLGRKGLTETNAQVKFRFDFKSVDQEPLHGYADIDFHLVVYFFKIFLKIFSGVKMSAWCYWRKYDSKYNKEDVGSLYHHQGQRYDQTYGKKCSIWAGLWSQLGH